MDDQYSGEKDKRQLKAQAARRKIAEDNRRIARQPISALLPDEAERREGISRNQLPLFRPDEHGNHVRTYSGDVMSDVCNASKGFVHLHFLKVFTDAGLKPADIACQTSAFSAVTNLQSLLDAGRQATGVSAKAKREGFTVSLTPEQFETLERYYAPAPLKHSSPSR